MYGEEENIISAVIPHEQTTPSQAESIGEKDVIGDKENAQDAREIS